jgi:hypothetical protein
MRAHATGLVALLSAGILLIFAACGGGEATRLAGGGERDTLPDGTPVVRYRSLDPPETVAVIAPDLTIGSLDGEGPDVFGDVRGIEADPQGRIYVLDYQAAEIRVFSPEGEYLKTIARRGEGPGEIGESNGFVLVGDTLWVHDHSKSLMLGLSIDGGELARSGVPVRSYAYIWMGTRDDRGRFWKVTSHSDDPRTYPPEPGLNEGSSRGYMKVYDPSTEQADSLFLGESTYRSWIAPSGGGFSYRGIPFESAEQTIVDPAGGFWRVNTAAYRIARLDEAGDTVLIVDGGVSPRPVTDADREAFRAPLAERSPEDARMANDILDHAPETLPVIDGLFVDAAGRLWVERHPEPGRHPHFDIFSRDGDFLGAVQLGFEASPWFTPRIRGSSLYTLVRDELDVPYVVRAGLPDFARIDTP